MRRILRFIFWATAIACMALWAGIIFSPYGRQPGFPYRVIESRISIAAPPDSVYNYLGDSRNAHSWSVFVDHIVPLNAGVIRDGLPGSQRRCFQQADEQGIQWDETIAEATPFAKRQIVMNGLHGFPMTVPHLATEQRYILLNDGSTELEFTLFFKDYRPTVLESLKMYIGAFKVHSIFEDNLRNIKREVGTRMLH